MAKKLDKETALQWVRKNRALASVAAILLIVASAMAIRSLTRTAPVQNAFHTVKRSDMLISIVEGGALKAVNESIIRSEFEGISRIISIVPEGAYVKKGDLLVELDSSELKDRVNAQEVSYQNSEFAFVQAKENLSIQKSLIESQIKDAELRVEFANSDLEKYKEGDAPQQINNATNRIIIYDEQMQRAQDRLEWTEQLHKKGYASKSELEADSLSLKQQKVQLEQAKEDLRLLIKYDQPKSIRKLESALEQAQKELDRLKLRTAAQIAQAEADLRTRQRALELTLEKLNQLKVQLANARIHAPQDGLVVYASSSPFGGGGGGQILIEEGAQVRQRQEIVKLPDVSEMLVEIRVHESHVLQVRPGLEAYVTVDSIPDSRFKARVRKVAVLPNSQSSWNNPNLKVYSTEVLIEDELPDLKPGVSARAEIIVTNLQSALSVPLQAVTTVKGKQVCYVQNGSGVAPVPVVVGNFNEQFIEVKSGLKEGDRVMLAPPTSSDEADLGASVIAAHELENHGAHSSTNNSNGHSVAIPGAPENGVSVDISNRLERPLRANEGATLTPTSESGTREPKLRPVGGKDRRDRNGSKSGRASDTSESSGP